MDKLNSIVQALNINDIINFVKEKKVLYVSESTSVCKVNKKLREEAWEAVTKSLIPDLQEYPEIEKKKVILVSLPSEPFNKFARFQ